MVRRHEALALLGLMTLPLALACKLPSKGGDAGPDAAPSASASASASDSSAASVSATASASAAPTGTRVSIPAPGNACNAAGEAMACSTDHETQLTCAGGIWRAMQSCRGAGQCKGAGASTTCDVGNPLIGDPCVASTQSKCIHNRSVQQCAGGKWAETVCMPPTTCHPATGAGPAACK